MLEGKGSSHNTGTDLLVWYLPKRKMTLIYDDTPNKTCLPRGKCNYPNL